MNRLFPRNRGFLRERYLDRDRRVPFDVEQPAAAALLVRASVFAEVGGFDPAFAPAWFEDVDLCAKILESGYRIRFVPAARASHVGGTTMRALPYDDYLPLYTRNLLRYLGRHAGLPVRAGARVVLAAGALLRLALLPVRPGRPRASRGRARLPPRPEGPPRLRIRRARSCRGGPEWRASSSPSSRTTSPATPSASCPPSSPRRTGTSSSSPSTTGPRTAPAPSLAAAKKLAPVPMEIVASRENLGFTGGHNVGIGKAVERGAEWVLVLNADVILAPDYLETLLADALRPGREWVGAMTGKILRADGTRSRADERRRHRRDPDDAERPALRRRRGRARHGAVGPPGRDLRRLGVRRALPGRRARRREDLDRLLRRRLLRLPRGRRPRLAPPRARLVAPAASPRPSPGTGGETSPSGAGRCPSLANLHSVKNRFLLRVNNAGLGPPPRDLPADLPRDLVVVGGCLTVERTSLEALRWLARNRARLLAKRHEILRAAHGFRPRPPALVRRRPGGRPDSGPGRVRIAILGTRGVPAAYGGFETLAEELSVRLAARGHDVTVYARRGCVREERLDVPRRPRRLHSRRSATSTSTPSSTACSRASTRPARGTTPSSSATGSTPSPAACRASSGPGRASS